MTQKAAQNHLSGLFHGQHTLLQPKKSWCQKPRMSALKPIRGVVNRFNGLGCQGQHPVNRCEALSSNCEKVRLSLGDSISRRSRHRFVRAEKASAILCTTQVPQDDRYINCARDACCVATLNWGLPEPASLNAPSWRFPL